MKSLLRRCLAWLRLVDVLKLVECIFLIEDANTAAEIIKRRLLEVGITLNMSRRGNCYGNPAMGIVLVVIPVFGVSTKKGANS